MPVPVPLEEGEPVRVLDSDLDTVGRAVPVSEAEALQLVVALGESEPVAEDEPVWLLEDVPVSVRLGVPVKLPVCEELGVPV